MHPKRPASTRSARHRRPRQPLTVPPRQPNPDHARALRLLLSAMAENHLPARQFYTLSAAEIILPPHGTGALPILRQLPESDARQLITHALRQLHRPTSLWSRLLHLLTTKKTPL